MLKIQKTFQNNFSNIYFVTTPIGNLNDICKHAIDILNNVNCIFCEDTRKTNILLKKYNIKNKLIVNNKFNEYQNIDVFKKLINEKQNIAIVSDAGLPGFSDPGLKIIENLIWKDQIDVNIVCVAGATALNYCLIESGIYFEKVNFLGFLDKKENKIEQIINDYLKLSNLYKNSVICFYESIHRIKKTITYLKKILNNDLIVICRELTKINEEIIRGSFNEVYQYLNSNDFVLKGEICVLIKLEKKQQFFDEQKILEDIENLVNQNYKLKQAIDIVCDNKDISKKEIYKKYLNMRNIEKK